MKQRTLSHDTGYFGRTRKRQDRGDAPLSINNQQTNKVFERIMLTTTLEAIYPHLLTNMPMVLCLFATGFDNVRHGHLPHISTIKA